MKIKTKPTKMWAWWDEKDQEYDFIYPSKLCVQICSPDFFKERMKRGEGKIVQVTIREKKRSKQ